MIDQRVGGSLRGRVCQLVVNRHGAAGSQGHYCPGGSELCERSAAEQRAGARAAGGHESSACGCRCAPGRGCSRSARGVRRAVAEDRRREPCAGKHRQHGRERLALGADGELEVTAAGTQLQVPAQRTAAKFAAAGHRDLLADVLAGCVTRIAVSDQGAARLIDERLDPVHRALKDRGDRLVGEVAGLGQQQR